MQRKSICRLHGSYERTLQQMPMQMELTVTLCGRLPVLADLYRAPAAMIALTGQNPPPMRR